jgi:hypothetical protein
MVSQGQRQAFRDLASAAGMHRDIFGTSWMALTVMEKCWSMRDEGRESQRSCDWLDAMKMLGYRILLI